jgi:hypothetical protein
MDDSKMQSGFSLVELLLALFVVIVVAGAGVKVLKITHKSASTAPKQSSNVASSSTDTLWQTTNTGGWKPNGTPPICSSPLLSQSPIDMARASEIMYPGQYRGTHYKAHGGFRIKPQYKNSVSVMLPMDMRLVAALRYTQGNDVQYLYTFENPCGIQVRFDHLLTLAGDFATIAEKLPKPTESTASVPPSKPTDYSHKVYKVGTLVATEVGGRSDQYGSGFDFGVYDLRAANEISKNQQWAAIHGNESSLNFYGRCWIDMLPSAESAAAKQILPLATDDRGASDYCDFDSGGSTLDYNNGQPVLTHETPNMAR